VRHHLAGDEPVQLLAELAKFRRQIFLIEMQHEFS
jgi:hypothetical protein